MRRTLSTPFASGATLLLLVSCVPPAEDPPPEAADISAAETGTEPDEGAIPDALRQALQHPAQLGLPEGGAAQNLFSDERREADTDPDLLHVLEDFADEQPGEFGISLQELDGQQRRAELNHHEQFTAASTYKLFNAYSTVLHIERGDLRWEQETSVEEKTIEECFEEILAESTNECSQWLRETMGRIPVEQDAHDLGLHGFEFPVSDIRAAAADLTEFLTLLERGQLPIDQEHRDIFLDALQDNIWREGISAGSSGEVFNKVGFLDDFLHDAAIVRHEEGTYVLTVLSEGSSWESIAELTEEIEAELYGDG